MSPMHGDSPFILKGSGAHRVQTNVLMGLTVFLQTRSHRPAMRKKLVGALAVTLALLIFGATQAVPLFATILTGGTALPLTSDSGTCFQNINRAGAQQTLSTADEARMLQAAESSSQYQSFAQGASIPPVAGSPAMQYRTAAECSGIVVVAYTFSFVSGGKELSVAVDPNTLQVVGTLVVPAVSWG
jgi:hypothetical protein